MKFLNVIRLGSYLLRTRRHRRFCDRTAFETWQRKKIQRFLDTHLPRSPFYRPHTGKPLDQLPIVDKADTLSHFNAINTVGITLAEATEIALAAEASRDFSPERAGITVGLSSGTQGARGVFLVSEEERARWAGILMARVLPDDLLRQLLFGARPVKVAFFLRANSNLYTTLKSRRVDFRFYDLLDGVDVHLPALAQQNPDLLVAPARILGRLAEHALHGALAIRPRRVVAVAEVLEPDDKAQIAAAFGGPVHQLYQCTEGFLGYTCEKGVMHLNEEFVHVEPEWLDADRTRFVPVVTDFSRTTQLIVRHRLGDVLRVRTTPCQCGRITLAIEAIEGRCDDVLWLPGADDGELQPLYPDMVRHAVTSASATLPDYRIEQHGKVWRIAVADEAQASDDRLRTALHHLLNRHGLALPTFQRMPFADTDAHRKRRRIRCIVKPDAGMTVAPGMPLHEGELKHA
jgi:putative adenylate-forming enzyme